MHAHMHNTYFLQGLATHFLSTINTYSSAKSIKEPLRKLQNCHAWWDLTNKNQSTHLKVCLNTGYTKIQKFPHQICHVGVGSTIFGYYIILSVLKYAFIVILPHKITSGHLPWEILRDIPIISPFPRQILRNCSVFESWWKPGRLEYPPTG